MRELGLPQSLPQTKSREAFPGGDRAYRGVEGEAGELEGTVFPPYRVLLAVRSVRLRADSVVRKGERGCHGSPA
jgi:hypothetical protein